MISLVLGHEMVMEYRQQLNENKHVLMQKYNR